MWRRQSGTGQRPAARALRLDLDSHPPRPSPASELAPNCSQCITMSIHELRTLGDLCVHLNSQKALESHSPTSSRAWHMSWAPAMGSAPSIQAPHLFRTRVQSCDGRDLRPDLSFLNVELLCMQNSTSSHPFLAHPPKNTSRTKSMRISILNRFCILKPALRDADRVP